MLAIIPALIVTTSGDRYAIPQVSVEVVVAGEQVKQNIEYVRAPRSIVYAVNFCHLCISIRHWEPLAKKRYRNAAMATISAEEHGTWTS